MNILAPQQYQNPVANAGIMSLISQLSAGASTPQIASAASVAAPAATTSRSNLGLLTQVAETQNIMARVMEMAFNTIDRVFNMATSLFSGQAMGFTQPGSQLPFSIGTQSGLISGPLPTESVLPSWLQTAIQGGKEIWGLLNGDSSVLIDGLTNLAPQAWNQIQDWAGGAWNSVKGMGSSIWDGIKNFGGQAWDMAKSAGSSIGGWVTDAAKWFGDLF